MTTYKDAGVDVQAGDAAVDRIRPLARETHTPGVLADIGSFGSFFELDLEGIDHPVLVSSVDGVGTKVKVAGRMGRYETIGQDLVNHCVNDIAVCGAQPLYFLDYVGVGDLEPDVAEAFVRGFATACKENNCALVGGEMAEMPDVYGEENFDLVGAITGLVDKDQILDGSAVTPGDKLLGLPSTGIHTNGYTLARSVLLDTYTVDDRPEALKGETVGEALLRVHRSYLAPIQTLMEIEGVHGFAHITGGGLPGNLRRILPDGCAAVVDYASWERPSLFTLIQEEGNVPENDMRRTFNLGIGLVVAVSAEEVETVRRVCRERGEDVVEIGRVVAGDESAPSARDEA